MYISKEQLNEMDIDSIYEMVKLQQKSLHYFAAAFNTLMANVDDYESKSEVFQHMATMYADIVNQDMPPSFFVQ